MRKASTCHESKRIFRKVRLHIYSSPKETLQRCTITVSRSKENSLSNKTLIHDWRSPVARVSVYHVSKRNLLNLACSGQSDCAGVKGKWCTRNRFNLILWWPVRERNISFVPWLHVTSRSSYTFLASKIIYVTSTFAVYLMPWTCLAKQKTK